MSWAAWVGSGRTIRVGAHDIFVRSAGTGPTLFFLHGFPTSSFDYAAIAPRLEAHHRCVYFDFLGYGASAKPELDYDYELQTQIACAVAEAEHVERAVVIAHDYGVTVGQELIARDLEARGPFTLDGVLFMNGGVAAALHRPILAQRFLASRLGRTLGPHVFNERLFERSMRAIVRRFEHFDLHEHYAIVTADHGAHVMPRLLSYIDERHRRGARWENALRRTTRPLAFAWGLADPISGAHMLEWARAAAPRARVTALAGIGHYPQLEDPDAVVDAIETFLDQ